ncbi:MAG: DUF2752 domain-containing protein [Firmicutes bacterium]|nr:DUF2752 domain-containing protein [Bacillota bacterium]
MQKVYRSRTDRKRQFLKFFLISIPIAVIIGAVILKIIGSGIFVLPECDIYKRTHVLCPGCGNTRAVYSLLNGDILTSLRYNPTIVGTVLVFTLYYIEMLFAYFGKNIQLMPIGLKFWLPVIIIWLTFLLARNFIPYFYNFLVVNQYG